MIPPFLSFCTTCKGRLHHLAKTLPENIDGALLFENVEFVLLDYDSPDGLDRWVQANLRKHLESGKLSYFRIVDRVPYFKLSHAKNVAHLLALGEVVCNLDADNYISPLCIEAFLDLHQIDSQVITHGRRSSWGRISLRKEHFLQLGGYEERLNGWGAEDQDLLARGVQVMGLKKASLSRFDRAIRHGNDERIRFMECKDIAKSCEYNRGLIRRLRRSGNEGANGEGNWGVATVQKNFDSLHIKVGSTLYSGN